MTWCWFVYLPLLLPLMAFAQIAAPPAPAPAPRQKWSILSLAHPDARLLLGIDWKRALASPLGPVIQKQVTLGGHALLAFLESIDNVERMMVSSPGSTGEGRPPLLVVGEGKFSLAQVRAMAKADGAVSRRFNDVELLVPPNATNADLHFALLDAQTVLFGDGASVKAAIVRRQNQEPAPEQNALVKRAGVLSMTQEAWALATEPSQAFAGIGITSSPLAAEVESLELQVSTSNTLSASVSVKAATAEAAETLGTGLPALLNLVALTYSGQPSLTQVARRLRTVTEQNYVKIGFTLDGKLLDQSLNELRASATPVTRRVETSASGHESGPEPVLVPAEATARMGGGVRKVIRIVGMDDGIREIPFEAKKD